jgi:acyl-homoserine lactone acylase PvdQ
MSNAMIVSQEESKTGNPLQWGAPQVGYANPSFFMDIDVHVPNSNVHYRGPAVPAASVLIPLGRGSDFAWTLTTGYSDAVDTKIEKLCNPDGGEATQDSDGYIYKGKCRKMTSRTETWEIAPTLPPSEPQPARSEERTFYRTVHGPVFERGTVKGKPVAFVKDRYFWKQELDSVAAFYKWNTRVRDIGDFRQAAGEFSMNFNAFYADSEDIGWFHVGYLPKRPKGMHPSLPTWGTGKWEFGKRFPFGKHPKAINPEQGWLANWNNKPSIAWDNTDQCCAGSRKWGAIQRVSLLQDQLENMLAGAGKVDMSDVVDVARIAATQDARGVYLGKKLTTMAAGAGPADKQEQLAAGLAAINTWIESGANRHNRDDNPDAMDDSPALALFDYWWDLIVKNVYEDELGTRGFELLGVSSMDYAPNTSAGGGFFFDFSSYLANLLNPKAKKKLALDYCDDRETDGKETCKQVVGDALVQAYDAIVAEQGADMSAWEKAPENIVFQELGAGSQDPIPWQNRGTHNHIAEILEDLNLPPFTAPKPSPSGSASPSASDR